MIRLFVGYDSKEPIAFHVLSHSVLRRATSPVSITPVALSQLHGIVERDRSSLQSTEFSFSRFIVPYLCGFKGWAIFMDSDCLTLGDVAQLWAYRDDAFAVQVVKHDYRPENATKFLGQPQTVYPMKNWSSVMLMNCARCEALTCEYVTHASGLDLHRFKWLRSESLIGEIPPEWNHLVGHSGPVNPGTQNLHFTEGGPWFEPYRYCDGANLWRTELRKALYAASD